MFRRIICLSLFFLALSCNKNQQDENNKPFIVVPFNADLTQYTENNRIIYEFKYDSSRLVTHNDYSSNGAIMFNYKYNESGRPDKIEVSQRLYNYVIYPIFDDTLLTELRVYIDDQFRSKYVMDYDNENRIIRVSRINSRNALLAATNIMWDGNNIKEYELKFNYVYPPIVYKYQYEYDKQKNPYKNVFRGFNYNLIEFLPISENNWTTMVGYNEDYPQNKLTLKNTFSYAGQGYPFVKFESAIGYDGKKSETYSEYKY
jgi:hypothetical protein